MGQSGIELDEPRRGNGSRFTVCKVTITQTRVGIVEAESDLGRSAGVRGGSGGFWGSH